MIYLDASALVKLLFEERESPALERWLADRSSVPKVTSELSLVEVLRVCRRYDEEMVDEARRLIAGVDLIPMVSSVVERAVTAGPPELRSLDAVHLGSAISIKTHVVAFVTYDQRLAGAATNEQLAVAAPS